MDDYAEIAVLQLPYRPPLFWRMRSTLPMSKNGTLKEAMLSVMEPVGDSGIYELLCSLHDGILSVMCRCISAK